MFVPNKVAGRFFTTNEFLVMSSPFAPVPARKKPNEPAVFVYGGNSRAVDFRLYAVAQVGVGFEHFFEAGVEFFKLGGVENIVEAEHGREVLDGFERFGEVVADAHGRRVGVVKLGEFGFEGAKLMHKPYRTGCPIFAGAFFTR